MNWDLIEDNWNLAKDLMQEKWGRLTDNDLDAIAGDRDQLIAKLEEKYRIPRDEAHRQVREFERYYQTLGGLEKTA